MLLSSPGRSADDAAVTEFLRHAAPPRIDLGQMRIAERRGRLLWAVLPVVSPGRTALVLAPPAPAAPTEVAAAGALIDIACGELAARGVHLAQALIDPADARGRTLFADHRFAVMAELIYLAGQPPRRRAPAPPAIPDGLEWVGYDRERTHGLFRDTIARSYERSLDCPALNGMRDLDDVVAGHQASGEFAPHLWRLLCVPPAVPGTDPEPLGVLLLSRVPQAGSLELVYLGLVPEARGRRLGDLLVRHALAATATENLPRLTLAVDARNAPALNVYYRNGMARVGTKVATMRDLRGITEARAPVRPVGEVEATLVPDGLKQLPAP
jgi:ribosomal protein S18 acetylase RimI-like enzyme